jgi:hypothetical protein
MLIYCDVCLEGISLYISCSAKLQRADYVQKNESTIYGCPHKLKQIQHNLLLFYMFLYCNRFLPTV